MIALLLAAVAVGLSNLAAAIGIGVTGVTARIRVYVGVVYGVFEAGMPIVGLLIGQRFATDLGQAVRWPGAILLMLVGAQGLVRSLRDSRKKAADDAPAARLCQSLPARSAGCWPAAWCSAWTTWSSASRSAPTASASRVGAILIGAVSVAMSLIGLELGGLLGRWAGARSEQMSGLILILVGAAIAGGALS